MKYVVHISAIVAVLSVGTAARAQDDIYVRGKDKAVKGYVAKESPKGVSLKDGAAFAAETIEDIVYEVNPIGVRLASYRPAVVAEKDSLDPAKAKDHKAKLDEAVRKYAEAAAKITEPFAKRHAEYKAAALLARQLTEEGKDPAPAIAALTAFKTKHADSWQIAAALELLGRLQLDKKDYPGARATFGELAQADVAESIKQEAQLQMIYVSIRAGKTAEAQAGLKAALAGFPKGSKLAVKAQVLQAELHLAAKNYDAATKLLRKVTKDTTDKELKALAYNALGVCLYEQADYKGARWEFLWVDVVYNQDKDEHAKALYYLWKIFEQIGDAEKAQDCRELLLNERAFSATEWRARAQKEYKAP
ncbi:MAG: tetratricopeptide repeat protein [Gemmataceae bacterium]|nr:tetratricopeptide repeat protein [Gemmataceae bacterium]